MGDEVLDPAFVTSSVRSHEPGLAGLPMELEAVLLHQSPDAEHRWAVFEDQEPSIHAEVGEIDLELALRLDDAVRRGQAHAVARPHAIEDVARQRVVGARVVGRPGVSYSDDLCLFFAREGRSREELPLAQLVLRLMHGAIGHSATAWSDFCITYGSPTVHP